MMYLPGYGSNMGKRYKIKITPAARDDIEQIFNYISVTLHSPQAAQRLMDEIEQAVELLGSFPLSHPFCADEMLQKRAYRKLVVMSYVILYFVDECKENIIIARAFSGSQNYKYYI